ncbi:MAG: thioredoxin domain-containing protein [Myxococcota bacterium]
MTPARSALTLALGLVLAAGLVPASGAATPRPLPAQPADMAAVEIVEVGDLECPFCGRAQKTIDDLRSTYGVKLTVRWLHNPLPFHQRALPGALALEAARNQGKLDAMLDLAFRNQQDLSDADLLGYARQIGLDLGRYQADIADPATLARVQLEQRIAIAVGATGTPSFFINGRSLRGAQPLDQFTALVDEELATAGAQGGEAYRKARLAAQNQDLFDYVYGGKTPPPAPAPKSAVVDKTIYKVTVDAKDAILGPALAPVTLVYFGDYQCPFCRKLQPTLAALREKYKTDLRIVVKHNPLPFHEQAMPAAKAAICAQAQKQFEAAHGLLMDVELDDGTSAALARTLKLDAKKFAACLADPKTAARITADMELAGMVTARGTPNSFINGRKVTGARPVEEFETIIDEALATAKKQLAAGTALKDLYPALIADGTVFEPLESKVATIDEVGAPRLGNAKAKIHLAVFADLQCPFSARLFPRLQELVDTYPGAVSVTFHHFPLSFHTSARDAALAATCAEAQGKFWDYVGLVFDGQKDLPATIDDAARTLGLDPAKLAACRADPATAALVDRQMANARAIEVAGTPTVYIQGRKFSSATGYNLEAFTAVIDKYYPGVLKH